MIQTKGNENTQQVQIKFFCFATISLLFIISFILATPLELFYGMKVIILSRDALITDYFALAGYGVAFFNCGIILSIVLILIIKLRASFTGLTLAAIFINAGFALFGKNPINILPILLGTYIYARVHDAKMNRYIYTALFGTCLSPLVTEVVYLLPFQQPINLILALLIGILIGFTLPTLAMHTASMHMGYNLFNVGFAAGILGFGIVSILEATGLESTPVLIWQEGRPIWLVLGLYGYFIATFFYGLWVNQGQLKPLFKILRHPGRAVADFILMDGLGATLMNMSVVGSVSLTYILLVKGDLSGPVIGGILTVFGFGAFGVHVKNFVPCMLGVYLSTYLKIFTPTMPSIQLAALFSAGIAPIAGQFGPIAGILAGMLHTSIVMCTSDMYSGLNLYNNGFSAGFVAIIMVPLLESFKNHSRKGNLRR